MKICCDFDDHFCDGFWPSRNLVFKLIDYCNGEKRVAKSFIVWAKFADDVITNLFPKEIDKEEEKRTLMYLYWEYQ